MDKANYRKLISYSLDSIAVLQGLEIKMVNSQLLKMFGCRHKKEMQNHMFTEFVSPEDRPEMNRMCLDRQKEEAFPYYWKFKALCCDGKTFDAELFTNLIEFHGQIARQAIIKDISQRTAAEKARRKTDKQLNGGLEARIRELEEAIKNKEETNRALKALLEKKERDQKETNESVLLNVNKLILPYIDKIKLTELDDFQKTYLDIIETNLKDIVSPFSRKMSVKELNLTPKELQVANLTQKGIPSKTIAQIMNISHRTVDAYRKNIRKKLDLGHKRVNLRSYLLSLNLPDID
ncbi:MAG: LuxR C-terminal-related transcriptional regulator [Desulfobacterales bacterium]